MTNPFCADTLILGMTENQINLREIHNIGPETKEWLVGADSAPALLSHGIYLVGWSETAPGFQFVRPTTPRAQVMATVAGSGAVWTDGKWTVLPQGVVYVTPEGTDSRYRHDHDPWTVVWVTWAPGRSNLSGDTRVFPGDPFVLCECIRALASEAAQGADPDALGAWCRLVAIHARRLAASDEPVRNPRLNAVWKTVEANPDRHWDLASLAEAAEVSPETLRRLCNSDCGTSPMHQVARIRMRVAAQLLSSGRYTVATVAARVGYDNPYAFSTAFRRITGNAPSHSIPVR